MPGCCSWLSVRADVSGDADLSAVHAVVNSIPASDQQRAGDEVDGPAGTGKAIKRIFAEQGEGGLPLRLRPES